MSSINKCRMCSEASGKVGGDGGGVSDDGGGGGGGGQEINH